MTVTRSTAVVGFKTAITDVLIQGLRTIFSNTYPNEPGFQSLNVVREFPLTANGYPCIVTKYVGRRVTNAGVGHYEVFPDPSGFLRVWMHRRYEGSFAFTVATLTTLQRDILSDALHEILSFGSITPALDGLLVKAYGEAGDPFSAMNLLFQVNMNTDELDDGGEGVTPTPWQSENALVFTSEYTMEVSGGFYNSPPNTSIDYISNAQIYPFIDPAQIVPVTLDAAGWTYTYNYYDQLEVDGAGQISLVETYTP